MSDTHPDDDALRALVAGTLTETQQADLESRLSAEPELRDRLDTLTAAAEFAATYIPPEPTAPPLTGELTALIETLHDTAPGTLPAVRDAAFDPATHLAPPRTDGAIGSLGDYDILEVVGQGGMGIVFRAHDPALQRTVAIKALAPHLAASPAAREGFLREARSAAALDHGHILPIHAVDQQGTLPYFVMPFVRGSTLHDLIEPGTPLPLADTLRYATAVSSALEAAHAAGLVHRDIKPANILTDPDNGRIWITDFGIAQPAGESSSHIAGTPHYISPEQASGAPTTPASDLFSLGVVLYEMATGSRPFDGETTAAVLAAVTTQDPPRPSQRNSLVPSALDSLVVELLAKDPADRPASAGAVTASLDSLSSPGYTRHRLALFAVTAAAVAVAAFFLRPDNSTPPPQPKPKPLFSLFGDDHSFASLADAIAATTPESATVVINSDATLELDPLTTPPHPVIIRAARGSTPTLRFSEFNEPLITATADLEIRHLTLVQRALRRTAEGIPPVIYSSGAPVVINHCRIARVASSVGRVPSGDFNLEIMPPIVRFENPAALTITRSEVYALRGVFISTLIPDGTTTIHIDNSLIATRRFLETTAAASTALELTLENNLLMTSAVVDFLPNPTHPQFQVRAHENIFELRGGMVWARGREPQEFASTFSWSGSSNVYQMPHVAVHYGSAFDITNADRASQRVFDQWVALPFVDETNSVSSNVKASDHLNFRNTALDTLTVENFRLHPRSDEVSPTLGPDVPFVGPGNARKPPNKAP